MKHSERLKSIAKAALRAEQEWKAPYRWRIVATVPSAEARFLETLGLQIDFSCSWLGCHIPGGDYLQREAALNYRLAHGIGEARRFYFKNQPADLLFLAQRQTERSNRLSKERYKQQSAVWNLRRVEAKRRARERLAVRQLSERLRAEC